MQSCSNTTHTQHHSFSSAIIPTASIVSTNKANLSASKTANMKLITVTTVALSALSFVVTGLCVDQRATQLSSRLALRSSNAQTTSNISITQGDVGQKNFTFDELFTLQKRFLDNFISPKNIIQVRFSLQTSIMLVLIFILGQVYQLLSSGRRCSRPCRYYTHLRRS